MTKEEFARRLIEYVDRHDSDGDSMVIEIADALDAAMETMRQEILALIQPPDGSNWLIKAIKLMKLPEMPDFEGDEHEKG